MSLVEPIRSEPIREGRAVAKFVPMSASKVRRSADQIRRKPLAEARRILAFNPQRGAKALFIALESAKANATNNFDLDEDKLFVHTVFIDGGPIYKRRRPMARGRAGMIRKRRCHITVILRDKDSKGQK